LALPAASALVARAPSVVTMIALARVPLLISFAGLWAAAGALRIVL
jgi:hypothetical protein